jgi:hypothetical protein
MPDRSNGLKGLLLLIRPFDLAQISIVVSGGCFPNCSNDINTRSRGGLVVPDHHNDLKTP